MSNNSTKQQELKHIASIVRALITSRKPPCNLRDILHEYSQVESKSLAYKALGYKTAQELLEDTGEFSFTSYGNGEVSISIIKFKVFVLIRFYYHGFHMWVYC